MYPALSHDELIEYRRALMRDIESLHREKNKFPDDVYKYWLRLNETRLKFVNIEIEFDKQQQEAMK